MRNNEDNFAYLFSSFITLIFFGLSVLFSWFFLEVPLTEEQYVQCEEIARETLENNMVVDYESIPDDLTVSLINNSRAIVKTTDLNRRGGVVAEKRHGKIVIERFDDQLFGALLAVFKGMGITALLSLVLLL